MCAVATLTRHTGYGNAAGLLANRGVYGLPYDQTNGPDFSSDSEASKESDEDADVNPVTGRHVLASSGCLHQQLNLHVHAQAFVMQCLV